MLDNEGALRKSLGRNLEEEALDGLFARARALLARGTYGNFTQDEINAHLPPTSVAKNPFTGAIPTNKFSVIMKTEIRDHTQDHANGELLYTWTLGDDGRAVCSSQTEQKECELDGIFSRGKFYYPKDGKEFLQNLPWEMPTAVLYVRL